MAAYRRVYDLRHLQADCQEPVSALGPYARQQNLTPRRILLKLTHQGAAADRGRSLLSTIALTAAL